MTDSEARVIIERLLGEDGVLRSEAAGLRRRRGGRGAEVTLSLGVRPESGPSLRFPDQTSLGESRNHPSICPLVLKRGHETHPAGGYRAKRDPVGGAPRSLGPAAEWDPFSAAAAAAFGESVLGHSLG